MAWLMDSEPKILGKLFSLWTSRKSVPKAKELLVRRN
jgi:hypothetical protein